MQRIRNTAIFTVAAMLIGTAAATAGPLGDHPWASQRVDTRLEAMSNRLDLSEAQRDEIQGIIEAHHQEADRLRQAMRQQIDAVLTDAQRQEWTILRDQRIERRLGRMSARLDLSDEQRDAIRAIFEEGRNDPDTTPGEVRERISAVLTPEQREQLEQPRGRRGHGHGRRGCDQPPMGR